MKPLAGSKVHSPFCQSICFLDELLKRIFRDKAFIYIPNLETKHDLTLYYPILDQSHTWLRFKLINSLKIQAQPHPTHAHPPHCAAQTQGSADARSPRSARRGQRDSVDTKAIMDCGHLLEGATA